MKVLIVGAGIGGITLAALLKQRGVYATIVEKHESFEHGGYMLGLYPLGNRVLYGLGLFDQFVEQSIPGTYYDICKGNGRLIKTFDMSRLTDQFGDIRMLTRPELIQLLSSGLMGSIRFNTTISRLHQTQEKVFVTLSNGIEEQYDLVVGSDGLNSSVRKFLFGEVPYYTTGWGGWVWWADNALFDSNRIIECWGKGRFLGIYPTKNKVGVFASIYGNELQANYRQSLIQETFSDLEGVSRNILNSLPDDNEELFYWQLSDARAPHWSKKRVVLLGDAATAFLPTAGVGASMAMESAAALNDELSRTNSQYVTNALDLFEKRRKKRVISIQNNSRKLAKIMMGKSRLMVNIRDYMIRFYRLESLIKSIAKGLNEPI